MPGSHSKRTGLILPVPIYTRRHFAELLKPFPASFNRYVLLEEVENNLEIALVRDMRTVPDMAASVVKSLVSRAHLMCRSGSLWPSMWLPPVARVL